MMMKHNLVGALLVAALMEAATLSGHAWDYEGHRTVNELALTTLPADFPAFVQAPEARDRIGFLAGEMDRWRNSPDPMFQHSSGPDHYMDIEELSLYGMNAEKLPEFRYEFTARLALARQAHPAKFAPIDPQRNKDKTRELLGFLPWALAESYSKLKSEFSYLKAFEQHGGTAEEIRNARENIIYTMGVMGHLAGDASQPLHTTMHHHGWVGSNPELYTTNGRIHSWIDGGYLAKVGGTDAKAMRARLRPAEVVRFEAREAKPSEMFQVAMGFLLEQHKLVEPLYRMEKAGELSGNGEKGLLGKAFLEGQLTKSAQLLGDLWYSAWKQAPSDEFLKNQLTKRTRAKEQSK